MSVSVQAKVVKTSAKAICVTDEFGEEVWVPKSQIESDSEITEDSEEGDEGELIVTDWIASEKGWE